ncbi:MAG: ATP-dependent DNA helicase [Nitrospirota bacterium]|nr:ATP-dependent DNA helicase [Nitrospirota bacterium]
MDSELEQQSAEFLRNTVQNAMENYELRPPQQTMMSACAKIIEEGGILLAEAGTGTGKTFAYLIPIILSGKKAIIATKTINLQEQLASKDLGFLCSLHGFSYAVAKGRGNYLCLRRMNAFRSDDRQENAEYRRIVGWASETGSGDREEYGPDMNSIWESVCSDADACRAQKCSYYRNCHYFAARQRWEKAQIVVANHALTTLNAMMSDEGRILPMADVLVVDEGHALDSVLCDQIGITLSARGIEYIFNKLLKVDHRGIYKGLLSRSPALFQAVESLRTETGLFWVKVRNELTNREIIPGRFRLSETMQSLSDSLKSLIADIRKSATGLFQEDDEIELKAALMKLVKLAEAMETFPEGMDGFVRWPEIEERKISLRMAPVSPGEFVQQSILPLYNAVILTSATLSVSGDFRATSGVLGLGDSEKLSVPSPFDLKSQIAVEIKRDINLKNEGSTEKLAQVIVEEAAKTDGGILVLFTSREAMRKTWELAHGDLKQLGFNPMLQGALQNKQMLHIMRESENSIIFGLDSFWEGVDVKGDALKCLIITKLPFEVPTEPMVIARTEQIRKNGGNPFTEYSLPRAVLKFKQGFGRLIRSKTDTGKIVICDERIRTMRYGRSFLDSVL